MRRTLSLAALAAALSYGPPARAEGPAQAYQTWLGVFAQGPLVGRLHTQSDLHYRAWPDGTPAWVLVRPGLAWQLAPGMFATVGYAYTPSWPTASTPLADRVDEHRAWEQWQYELPVAGGALRVMGRARLEQRWRPSVSDDVGHRARLMARVTVPLGARWLVAAWDELFVAFNDTGWRQRAGFDQNRLFVGAGVWAAPGHVRVELGYFNQYIRRAGNPAGDLVVHAAMLNTWVLWR